VTVPIGLAGPLLALSNGEVILVIFFVALPIAAIVFIAGAGKALKQVGKGQFSVDFDSDAPRPMRDSGAESAGEEIREDEIRQMLEAKAYRQSSRGEAPLDVDAEFERLMAESQAAPTGDDPQLREEVRQLVVARNERRARQGKEPLDVEAEIERQLRELENLGQ
jgi:hypothetical protein